MLTTGKELEQRSQPRVTNWTTDRLDDKLKLVRDVSGA